MRDVVVSVFRRSGRKKYQAEWRDSTTGRICSRSTGTTVRRDAERFGAELARQLTDGTYRSGATPWRDFTERFLAEGTVGLRESSVLQFETTFRAVERIIRPATLEVVARREVLSRFRRELAGETVRRRLACGANVHWQKSPAAVNRHLRTLSAALGWALSEGLLGAVPKMPFVRREGATKAKARPVTTEEFERMLAVVDKVAPREADEFRFLMRLIWATGLRIGEAMRLSWFDGDVALDRSAGGGWLIRFAAAGHKANRDQLVPLTPDAVRLIESIPEELRHGYVALPSRKRRKPDNASKTIADIGRRASVYTRKETRDGKTIPKAASAHDLRRSFGTRWASRVMPQVLGAVMRHKSPQTTLTYYVDFAADELAETLFRAAPTDTFTDTKGEIASDETGARSPKSFARSDFGK